MSFQTIKHIISDIMGMNPDSIGEKSVEFTIDIMFKNSTFSQKEDYLDFLISSKEEQKKLIEEIRVPETWFFRDMAPFEFFQQQLKKYMPINSKRPIRVLSIPCSSGEEAYTIAISAFEAGLLPHQIKITACDISPTALEQAKHGEYSSNSFRHKLSIPVEKYFYRQDDKFLIKNFVKNIIDFRVANIVASNFLQNAMPFDFIFCRNLIIYLTDEAKAVLLKHFNKKLKPDGSIITGHSEINFFCKNGFSAINYPSAFAVQKATETIKEKSIIPIIDQILPTFVPIKPVQTDTKAPTPFSTHDKQSEEEKKEIIDLEQIKSIADSGDLKQAHSHCLTFLELNNTDPKAYFLIGLISEGLRQFAEAQSYYEKAIYLNPTYLEAMIHLNLLYKKHKQTEKNKLLTARIDRLQDSYNE